MNAINIVFPHQLYRDSPLFECEGTFYLIEEFLFFKQYKFHKQKITFHRATMKYYEGYLKNKGYDVFYIESSNSLSDIRSFNALIKREAVDIVNYIDPVDNWLENRLKCAIDVCEVNRLDNPQFLNTEQDLGHFFKEGKKSFFQTTFYKQQRVGRNILVESKDQPVGGKWTYDVDNRKKYPRGKNPPAVVFPDLDMFWEEALKYTEENFNDNYGNVGIQPLYPITHEISKEWFFQFLERRFHEFGTYEDAIVKGEPILNHSVLSPLINVGLILPGDVINESLNFAAKNNVPMNSIEGFVRQIIGWREFIRGMYLSKGNYSRTKNFWGFTRKIPSCFYDGTTGIEPVDDTIKTVLKTGYCHHIERLMILGNFMLLCEFDPDEVYQWFMELFIDAYDWVMVPNVYGMSQFADGGTFATKPYIGGSNYIKKMSNYSNGEWQKIWDGLFWRFIDVHQDFFKGNQRMSMMYYTYNRMSTEKQQAHLENAQVFIEQKLDRGIV